MCSAISSTPSSRTHERPAAPSHVNAALAMFGLTRASITAPDFTALERAADALLDRLAPGDLVLVTGPSGSGKSTLLRALARRLAAMGVDRLVDTNGVPSVRCAPSQSRAIIDQLAPGGSPQPALSLLSAVGLADAALLTRTPEQLSDGQRSRFRLALALQRAMRRGATPGSPPTVLIGDEFASLLDRPSAMGLARTLARWVRSIGREHGIAAVFATAHQDIEAWLEPTIVVRFDAAGRWCVQERGLGVQAPGAERQNAHPESLACTIEPGARADYHALAHWHYRSSTPATIVRVLRARLENIPEIVGVLTVSMPALNGAHRELAWPGRYTTHERAPRASGGGSTDHLRSHGGLVQATELPPPALTKRDLARRLNAELRTISRVIVDPRFRGMGIARRLVRAYLDDPATPATEAIAAMGAVSPFFEHAGMTAYRLPPSPRDARMLDALAYAGLTALDLVDTDRITERIAQSRFLSRELLRWCGASRATNRSTHADLPDIIALLSRSIGAGEGRPIAYAAGGY